MEMSLLLAQQIAAMFLMMATGYAVVKLGVFCSEDSKIISNMVVYICSPCVMIDSFQIELTQDKVKGLMLAAVVSVLVHIVMIAVTKLIGKPLRLNSIEKTSVIYSNSGYLVIPLVAAVLGKEWVFYCAAYLIVQAIPMWTHANVLISGEAKTDYKKILLNPNIIAIAIGLVMFLAEWRFPRIIGTCVSGFGDMISPVSMLVVGMVMGNVDLKWAFTRKRAYLICLLRLIAFPLLAVVSFGVLAATGIHPDAEYILLVVLLATAAPAATMITQMAQIHGKDAQYASVLNVLSVIFCIVTMPVMVLLYEWIVHQLC